MPTKINCLGGKKVTISAQSEFSELTQQLFVLPLTTHTLFFGGRYVLLPLIVLSKG